MSEQEQQNWYYASATNERLGPVSIQKLSDLAAKGIIGPKTLVWNQGYPDWIPAEQISDQLTHAQTPATLVSAPPKIPAVEQISSPADGDSSTNAPAAAATSSPTLPRELKPKKGSFVFPRIITAIIASGLFGGGIAIILLVAEQSPWPGLAVFIIGSLLGIFSGFVAYRKELYQIEGTRVVCHRGGLLSDQTTEFEIRNITHVKLKLPWLRFKFFGVGDVIVQTAGNSKPVVLRVISEAEAVYAGFKDRMRQNGYDLTQQHLLHEERPAIIAIIGESFGLLFGLLAAGTFLSSLVMGAWEEARLPIPEFALPGLVGIIALGILAFIVVRFLDYRRRTYRVYNDVVVYEEGFLTRHNAFIPYENIADADTKSTFFDQIFSLSDVQVSCQGSGSEIKFRRLRNGVALSDAIDQLVVNARQKKKPASRFTTGEAPNAALGRPRRKEMETIPAGEILVGDFGMNAARTMVPLLFLLPLVPIWIAAMIQSGIRLASTKYSVRPGSLRHSYRFLTVHEREFAYDKITGMVIKQNLWDRMFGTMTLRFWSIGSGQPLEFAHVHATQINLPALMRQSGIPDASLDPYQVDASFGLLCWLRAKLNYLPLLLIFAGGTIFAAIELDPAIYYLLAVPVLVLLIACIHSKLYHSRQRLRFHEHHVEAEQGVIAKRRYFARYSNIKRSETSRYPGGEHGDLKIFVAGEEEMQQGLQQKKTRQTILKPCAFTTGFLPGVRGEGLLLDDILCGRVEPTPDAIAAEPLELLLEARRSVANALVKLVLLSIIVFPLIVLLPFTIPATVIRVKRWRYRIDAARIIMSWGIIYRRETSILLDRVDSLQQKQGPLNKLCGNGNVSVMTAGSSKPDLNIVDSPAYLNIYEVIRERSQ